MTTTPTYKIATRLLLGPRPGRIGVGIAAGAGVGRGTLREESYYIEFRPACLGIHTRIVILLRIKLNVNDINATPLCIIEFFSALHVSVDIQLITLLNHVALSNE